MASTQTSFDSMLRRLDENQTRHDEHQRSFDENQARHDEHKRSFEKNERSFEELKDMMRTLLVMEGMHSPSEEHQDRVDPAPSTNWILNGANREEQRKRLEDHHSCREENRVCMEPTQKITEHRFEFSINAIENLFKDRDQDRSEVVGGVNLGVQSSAFEANSTPVMPKIGRNSTNLSFDESGQKLEGQRIHSEGPQAQEQSEDGGNGKPEAILEVPFVAIVEPNEDDPKSTSFLSEILAIQPLAVNTTGIVSYKPLVSNFEENSENLKKQEEDQWLIEELPMGNPEQFTDMIGSTRNFSGDLPQESRDISSSLEIKFKEGNNRILDVPTITRAIVTSEFVFEEMGEVVDATVEPVGFIWAVVKMSKAENLEIHSAHHVFVKLFEEQLADVTHSVALPSTLGDNCGSIESFGSFVFDPGKEIEFHYLSDQSHLESVETILVFDPGGDLLTLLLLSLCYYGCL